MLYTPQQINDKFNSQSRKICNLFTRLSELETNPSATTDASSLTSGTLDDARLSTNVTKQGNTFNGISQLVQLDSTGKLPALDGSLLTNLPANNNASNLTTGTLADARLTANVVLLDAVQTLTNKSIAASQLTGSIADARLSSNIVTLTGAQTLTNKSIDSGQLTGSIADARLSSNIALLNTAQTFSASKSYATGTDTSWYNTADQTTNYERVRAYWNNNQFNINTESGGTGSLRILNLTGGGVPIRIGGTNWIELAASVTSSGTNRSATAIIPTSTATSGTFNYLSLIGTINQSSTAGYKALWISPYEQATGSGSKLLIDAGTNSAANGGGTHTSKFSVDNVGNITGNSLNAASGVNVAGTQGLTFTSGTLIVAQATWATLKLNASSVTQATLTSAGVDITNDLTVNGILKDTAVFNTQTGTTYTLVLTDRGEDVEMNNASVNTVTVPPNSSVAYPIGSKILIRSIGVGQTTIVAGTGVTILSEDNAFKLRTQYSSAMLTKRGTDSWSLDGSLV